MKKVILLIFILTISLTLVGAELDSCKSGCFAQKGEDSQKVLQAKKDIAQCKPALLKCYNSQTDYLSCKKTYSECQNAGKKNVKSLTLSANVNYRMCLDKCKADSSSLVKPSQNIVESSFCALLKANSGTLKSSLGSDKFNQALSINGCSK